MLERANAIGAEELVTFVTVNLGEVAWLSGDFHVTLEKSLEAAELFRASGDESGLLTALDSCAWAALALRDPARAKGLLYEVFPLATRLRADRRLFTTTCGLGAALARLGEWDRGAQLFGAAASLREDLPVAFTDERQEGLCEQALTDARAALREEAFAAAWSRGREMAEDEIRTFARGE